MDQFTFEAIIKIVSAGAPVLAEELTNAFVRLVESEQTLRLRNEELEKQVTSYTRLTKEGD